MQLTHNVLIGCALHPMGVVGAISQPAGGEKKCFTSPLVGSPIAYGSLWTHTNHFAAVSLKREKVGRPGKDRIWAHHCPKVLSPSLPLPAASVAFPVPLEAPEANAA